MQVQSDCLETVAVVPGFCVFVPFLWVMLLFGKICFSCYYVESYANLVEKSDLKNLTLMIQVLL